MKTRTAVCIGTASIDIKGFPDVVIQIGGSSLGHVHVCPGGIARNMAETLARLGWDTYLLSAVGADSYGEVILNQTTASGVHTEFIERCSDFPTARYVTITDAAGVSQLGVFDGEIIAEVSTTYLARYQTLLAGADLLVTHTAVSPESLSYLARVARDNHIPWYVNATSASLARRALEVANASLVIGANHQEAEALTGSSILDINGALAAANSLISAGSGQVIFTLDEQGLVYVNSSSVYHCRPINAKVVDTTGAGDALCSAFLASTCEGHSVLRSLRYGLAAAAMTIESRSTVNPSLSRGSVLDRLIQEERSPANSQV